MSLFNYLQFQKIDESSDDVFDANRKQDESISLDEQIDENSLEQFWDKVVSDIHDDPEWFRFSD